MSRGDHFDKLAPDIPNHSNNGVPGMKTVTSKVTGHGDDVLFDTGCRAKVHEVRFPFVCSFLHVEIEIRYFYC